MGHYYSEMVSDEEQDAKAASKEAYIKRRAKRIEKAIKERGIARVLAEIIDDPTMASIHFHGHP